MLIKVFKILYYFFQLEIPALFKHFPFSGLKPVLVHPVGKTYHLDDALMDYTGITFNSARERRTYFEVFGKFLLG